MIDNIRTDMLKVKRMVTDVEMVIGKREGESKLVNKLIDAENLLTYCMSRLENAIVPPCKVGDTVYEIQEIRNRVQAYKVTKIITDGKYFHFEWRVNEPCGVYGKINGFEDYELGRYVFLSKEAAEKALKGCVG